MRLTKKQAVVKGKCPRCHRGDVFQYAILSSNPFKAHKFCPVCGHRFEIEPGFFWGAMYISYMLSVGIYGVIVLGIYTFIKETSVWMYVVGIVSGTLILAPLTFRLSRLILVHYVGGTKYDEHFGKQES